MMRLRDCGGQSTVEAAIILLVLLSLSIFLAAMWKLGSHPSLVTYAENAASHILRGGGIGAVQDIISF